MFRPDSYRFQLFSGLNGPHTIIEDLFDGPAEQTGDGKCQWQGRIIFPGLDGIHGLAGDVQAVGQFYDRFQQLGDEAANVDAYFVSIDPQRDTPDVMDAYVSNVSDRIVGITGDPEKVAAMAKSFGIFVRNLATGPATQLFDGSFCLAADANLTRMSQVFLF